MQPDSFIQLHQISKKYRDVDQAHPIFHKFDATFQRGESVALLGRSGSGKTTLLNLISGIDLPDSGSVTIDGINIVQLSENQRTLFRRQHIGFVFQFFNLIPTLSVLENVLLPLELLGRLDRQGQQHAKQLLAQVGLADRVASYPDTLSGGEQQRVAIARAIVHRPQLLLADEPTGNLDAETSASILDLLRQTIHQTGVTLIMVTHSHEIAQITQRVITMKQGRILAAP